MDRRNALALGGVARSRVLVTTKQLQMRAVVPNKAKKRGSLLFVVALRGLPGDLLQPRGGRGQIACHERKIAPRVGRLRP